MKIFKCLQFTVGASDKAEKNHIKEKVKLVNNNFKMNFQVKLSVHCF